VSGSGGIETDWAVDVFAIKCGSAVGSLVDGASCEAASGLPLDWLSNDGRAAVACGFDGVAGAAVAFVDIALRTGTAGAEVGTSTRALL
jgi:hypothetical protein